MPSGQVRVVQHNVACLLVRLGRHEEPAKVAVLALQRGVHADSVASIQHSSPR